ncbi:unnamed protein product [Cyclocybe aegerita]|uniref:Uncharacterized protein n=1 Tax=Cyclocybe aegerita TaxID=1973307 RepID=A0A8S0VR67_CYCAE|nr:unnamed protein product [Cyclocybe aegerita]
MNSFVAQFRPHPVVPTSEPSQTIVASSAVGTRPVVALTPRQRTQQSSNSTNTHSTCDEDGKKGRTCMQREKERERAYFCSAVAMKLKALHGFGILSSGTMEYISHFSRAAAIGEYQPHKCGEVKVS